MADWDGALYGQVNSLQRELAARSLAGVDLHGGERLLDVGCGDGRVTAALAERLPTGSALGIDPSPLMIETARELPALDGRLRFEPGDVLEMRFAGEFDVVVSFNTLHWVRDQASAFAPIRAAVRAQGWVLLQFVCAGPRPSLEATAMRVCQASRWRSSFRSFEAPFLHAAPAAVRTGVETAGFAVDELSVDDVSWDFGSPRTFARWCFAGFPAWTSRLPDQEAAEAFVAEVVAAYADVTGSEQLLRFLQLRARLHPLP